MPGFRAFLLVSATALVLGTFLACPAAPARAETAGDIYIVDPECCGGTGGLLRVDPQTGAQTIVSSGGSFGDPVGLAIAPDGMIYVTDTNCCGGNQGAVIRVNPSLPNGSNQTIISSGGNLDEPVGIVIAADGTLYVADDTCCGGGGAVVRVIPSLPNGSNQAVVSSGGLFVDPVGIVMTPDGMLYVVDQQCCTLGHGGVIRVDPRLPSASNQALVASGGQLFDPVGLARAADGMLYVAETNCCELVRGAVIRIDPSLPNGANQTLVSTSGNFADPIGIAVAMDGTLYVTDASCCGLSRGALIRVDPTLPNGANQVVVSPGGTFVDPVGVAVVPSVAVADASITEGSAGVSTVELVVTYAPSSAHPVTVQYATSDGTAVAGADYGATSGTLTFQPGETTKTVAVPIVADRLAESSETFSLTLMPPAGVGAARGTATAAIQDDDGTATLAIGDAVAVEGNGGATPATFTVSLSPASGQVVTVQVATSDGTAVAGSGDYASAGATLTFQPGESSKQIQVQVNGDGTHEPDEAFSITLSNPTGGAVLGRAQGTGTIRNDDPVVACTPLPRVRTTPVAGGGRLLVHVEATPLNIQQNNPLQSLTFDRLDNARVTQNGLPVAIGQTVTVPANTVAVDFAVERMTPGQASTVHFTVVDGCGPWKTFVGGGTAAGF